MRIKDVYKTVLETLIDMPRARKDDNFLYVVVCAGLCPEVVELPFYEAFYKAKEYKLVPYESVRRARQKAQAEHPELRDVETTYHRNLKEEEYREFARS